MFYCYCSRACRKRYLHVSCVVLVPALIYFIQHVIAFFIYFYAVNKFNQSINYYAASNQTTTLDFSDVQLGSRTHATESTLSAAANPFMPPTAERALNNMMLIKLLIAYLLSIRLPFTCVWPKWLNNDIIVSRQCIPII